MTEEEALLRAREAAARSFGPHDRFYPQRIRDGLMDSNKRVQAAKRALLDADMPLPVNRDIADLRELVAAYYEGRDGSWVGEAKAVRGGDGDFSVEGALTVFRDIIAARLAEAGK